MVRGSEFIDRELVTRDAGEKVGKVDDLVIDERGTQVIGLLVRPPGLLSGARVVRWSAIVTVAPDVLIIDSASSVVQSADVPEMKEVLDRGNLLAGVQVRTTDGEDLGRVESFYFDPKTGRILGYELSGGANRKRRSRSFLPTPASFEAGKDVAFVEVGSAELVRDLEEVLGEALLLG